MGAGSTSAGIGPVVAMRTVDLPTRDQVRAVADVSTTQESLGWGNVSGKWYDESSGVKTSQVREV